MGLATPLVGRNGEVDQVLRTLRASGGCLISGPVGVGKTTVARAVAGRFRTVQWVDAESLPRATAVQATLHDQLDPNPLPGGAAAPAAIAEHPVLVVLDGLDDLVDEVVALVDDLPLRGDGPWLLVTSRRLPRAPSLPVVRLSPLSCDGPDGDPSALVLFRRRFAEAGGDPTALDEAGVAALVTQTGGLPAAIEIVAARTALLGFEDLPSTVDAADVSVDAVVGQSLTRLHPDAAQVLLALGATADVVPRSLVVAVSGLPAARVDEALVELGRHGLVLPVRGGVTLLPPVRRSAWRRAALDGGAEASDRHLRWCRDLVAASASTGRLAAHGTELTTAIARRAALTGGLTDAVDLAVALAGDRAATLQHRSGYEVLDALLRAAEPLEDHPERHAVVRLLLAAARYGSLVHGVVPSLRLLDRAEGLLVDDALAAPPVPGGSPTGDRAEIARTRSHLAFDLGDLALAEREARRGRELARRTGDDAVALECEYCLATVLFERGRLDAAEALAERVAGRTGPELSWLGGLARQVTGFCALDRGSRTLARSIALAELERCHRTGERDGALEALFLLMAADPVHGAEVAQDELTTADAGSWLLHLQLQRARIVRSLVAGEAQAAALAAADAVVVAGTMPHRFEEIEASLLLGDASLCLGESHQAGRAFDRAVVLALRCGSVLRAADALDGWAAVLAATHPGAARAAAATAAEVRRRRGARRRPRPWLDVPRPAARVPDGWVRRDRVTADAARALRQVGVAPPPTHEPLAGLSRSERVVAELVAQGCTNREISERLVISRRTVETHVAHAFHKLGVHSRSQLATRVTRAVVGPWDDGR